jgi:glycosyltransferase involved in cell wall biosynthesis
MGITKMKKKKLIYITRIQFGYENDMYYFCKYLKDDYSITFICWDFEFPKFEMPGVRVVYVSRKGMILTRTIRLLRLIFSEFINKPTIIIITYFKIVPLLLKLCKYSQCFVLDIRTGCIERQPIVRAINDAICKFEIRFFKHITVISMGLAEKLNIANRAHILPLGAEIISREDKTLEALNLIYVGTLYNRDIEATVKGFKQFYDEFCEKIPMQYTIIGGGKSDEENKLRELVARFSLTEVITIKGMVPHDKLKSFFDYANIGVSYIPITDYYDVQPPTKTFEYLLSGMPVIATNTSEHRKLIFPETGVLIGDTVEEFYVGLKDIYKKRKLFDSKKIRDRYIDSTWEKIMLENFKGYLENIC